MHVQWDNTGAVRRWQRLLLLVLHRGPMGQIVSRMWTSALDRYGRSDGTGAP